MLTIQDLELFERLDKLLDRLLDLESAIQLADDDYEQFLSAILARYDDDDRAELLRLNEKRAEAEELADALTPTPARPTSISAAAPASRV